jgi:hypothetical protein
METNNLQQRYTIKFCVKLGDSATGTHKKIQKKFGNDYHVLKYFDGTKTLQMGEKQWKTNRHLDAPPLWEQEQTSTM